MKTPTEVTQVRHKFLGLRISSIVFAVLSILAFVFQSLVTFKAVLVLLPIIALLLIILSVLKDHKSQTNLMTVVLLLFTACYAYLGIFNDKLIFGLGSRLLNIYFLILLMVLALINAIALFLHLAKKSTLVLLVIEFVLTLALILPLFLFLLSTIWAIVFLTLFLAKFFAYLVLYKDKRQQEVMVPLASPVPPYPPQGYPVPPSPSQAHPVAPPPENFPAPSPQQYPASPPPPPTEPVIPDQAPLATQGEKALSNRLEELERLYAQKLINDQEFQDLRKRILNDL